MWEPGRQGTGYFKYRIFESKWLKLDIWLLKFPVGSFIPVHIDPVVDGRHFRLNLFIKRAKSGGEFTADSVIYQNQFCVLFRPDMTAHSVSKVESGTRYVLSFGVVLK